MTHLPKKKLRNIYYTELAPSSCNKYPASPKNSKVKLETDTPYRIKPTLVRIINITAFLYHLI